MVQFRNEDKNKKEGTLERQKSKPGGKAKKKESRTARKRESERIN